MSRARQRGGAIARFLRGVFLLIVLAGVAVAGYCYWQYRLFSDSPLAIEQPRTLEIAQGSSFNRIVGTLREEQLTAAHPLYWRALAWEMGVMKGLHAGEYRLEPGMTPRALLAHLAKGSVLQHRFTIVEGWTFRELRAALAKHPELVAKAGAMSDAELMTAIGADGVAPEGRFLPETYQFSKGGTDLDLLKRAYAAMQTTLTTAWEAREPGLPLANENEALVLASIIEKETGVASERPQIAGVFVRRLKIGMLLQTDPTVIYGLGTSFDGNLTRAHLEADTPYNTYTRAGLPPTPIALPGKAAIEAALHPAPGDTLYFVSRGDGSHVFTSSLAEHQRAVNEFQLRRRRSN